VEEKLLKISECKNHKEYISTSITGENKKNQETNFWLSTTSKETLVENPLTTCVFKKTHVVHRCTIVTIIKPFSGLLTTEHKLQPSINVTLRLTPAPYHRIHHSGDGCDCPKPRCFTRTFFEKLLAIKTSLHLKP
jgi:hypothetical protein